MRVLLILLLVGCARQSAPVEPVPPPAPDAAVLVAPATQTPPTSAAIRASSYPQACTRDDECIGVFEGDACNPCRCAFNAIRVDAFAKYRSDLGQFWACHKADECKTTCRQAIGATAKCEGGTCSLPP